MKNETAIDEKNFKRLAIRYLTEILIIFVGITISFMFDRWREAKNDDLKEIEFVESLQGDLDFKTEEILNESQSALEFVRYADTAFSRLYQKRELSDSVIRYLLQSYNSDNNFFNQFTPTFNNQLGSEQYRFLPDTLRRSLFSLYSSFDYLRLYFESASHARFNFKNNQMASANLFSAQGVILKDGTTLRKPDYPLISRYCSTDEFINNLLLIRTYEMDKVDIMKRTNRQMLKLNLGLAHYKKSLK